MCFSLYGGTISGNETNYNGGGIYAKGSETNITIQGPVKIRGNETTMYKTNAGGGGIYLYSDASLNVGDDVSILGNISRSNGGGIYNTTNGKVILANTSIFDTTYDYDEENQASGDTYGHNIFNTYRISGSDTDLGTLD